MIATEEKNEDWATTHQTFNPNFAYIVCGTSYCTARVLYPNVLFSLTADSVVADGMPTEQEEKLGRDVLYTVYRERQDGAKQPIVMSIAGMSLFKE